MDTLLESPDISGFNKIGSIFHKQFSSIGFPNDVTVAVITNERIRSNSNPNFTRLYRQSSNSYPSPPPPAGR